MGSDVAEVQVLGAPPLRTFAIERPWLHELRGNDLMYRWLTKNILMRNDEHGIEIRYRYRKPDDVICGARTIRPGIPGCKGYSWRMDQSVDHEVVCNMVGDHGEAPHVGVPADCADMTCKCSQYGSYHLVMVEFAVRSEATPTWDSRWA